MNTTWFSKTLGTTHPSTQYNISEDCNPLELNYLNTNSVCWKIFRITFQHFCTITISVIIINVVLVEDCEGNSYFDLQTIFHMQCVDMFVVSSLSELVCLALMIHLLSPLNQIPKKTFEQLRWCSAVYKKKRISLNKTCTFFGISWEAMLCHSCLTSFHFCMFLV